MNKSDYPGAENQNKNQDKGFTVKEVASFLGETPNVIRNWFKELRTYIPHEKDSNGYNIYKREGIEQFKEIQALHRKQNWSIKQIEQYFFTGREAFKPDPEKSSGEMLAEEIRTLREEIAALREENQRMRDQQGKFNQALIEKIQQGFQQIERGSKERDVQLVNSLRESMENQRLIAAAREEEKQKEQKKGFWSRLLGT